MKLSKGLLFLMVAFVLVLTGCVNGVDLSDEPQSLEVQKTTGDSKTITDKEKVQKASDIVSGADFEEMTVSMSRVEDYTFSFPNPNAKTIQYKVWVNSIEDTLELTHGDSAYIQLSKEDSAALFEILAGMKITELK